MININVDPIWFQFGNFPITWHGITHAAGILVTYLIFTHLWKSHGFPKSQSEEISFWVLLSGLVFARLFVVFENWHHYLSHPIEILAIHKGGLTVLGGITGALIAVMVYARAKQLKLSFFLDAIALSAPLGYIVGITGCLILGDIHGVPTNGSWGLVYWHPNSAVPGELIGVPTFPAPLFFQLTNLLLWILCMVLRKFRLPQGSNFAIYLLGYGFVRFTVGYWQPKMKLALGLSYYQWIAAGLMIVGIVSMMVMIKSHKDLIEKPAKI